MITTTSKNKPLLIIIGILLVANLVLLSFLLLNKAPGKKNMHGDRKEMITLFLKNELGFNQQQLQQYDTLNAQHRRKVKAMFEEVNINKEQQFKVLSGSNYNDSTIAAIAEGSAKKQQQIEVMMLQHFRDVRYLCKPEQLPKFDTLFYKLLNRRTDARKK